MCVVYTREFFPLAATLVLESNICDGVSVYIENEIYVDRRVHLFLRLFYLLTPMSSDALAVIKGVCALDILAAEPGVLIK
jgi:hypothetical protein